MYKNTPGQRVSLLAINTFTNNPVVGDAANILGFIKKDNAALAPLATPTCTEVDAVNGEGLYEFVTTQPETNADRLVFTGKSTTPNVKLIPLTVYTLPIALATLGTGYGARTLTVTVTDGVSPIQSAIVRMTKGAESYYAVTNASGQIVFNLDDGTWQVAISKSSLYTFAGATLVLTGDGSVTYVMTVVALMPSVILNSTTGQTIVYGKDGLPAAGVSIDYWAFVLPDADVGVVYDSRKNVSISDFSGIAQFPNLVKGMTYNFQPARAAAPYEYLIPPSAGASYQLPSMLD